MFLFNPTLRDDSVFIFKMKKLADRLLIFSFFIITNTVSINATSIYNKVTPVYPRFCRHSLSKKRNITGYFAIH